MKKEKEKKKKKRQPSPAPEAKREAQGLEQPGNEAEESPGQQALAHFSAVAGGKWKLRILWALRGGSGRRYGEIRTEIPGITDMMLSQSLKELTADGLIQRRQYQEIPPKVEYRLTKETQTLLPALDQIRIWAQAHEEKRKTP